METKEEVVHLFECTQCDFGDYTSKEWNEATEDEVESGNIIPIEEAVALANENRIYRDLEYHCPGCRRASTIWNMYHYEVKPKKYIPTKNIPIAKLKEWQELIYAERGKEVICEIDNLLKEGKK